jgi:hypothetical protein
MAKDDRQAVAQMDIDLIGSADDFDAVANCQPPDEWIDISHEGGEHEVFADLADDIALATG